MTQHDQISAFIDNELPPEQEQDFLISLASSDGLRKSFRSELVLKNVIHQDEILTTPSRSMRNAVLGSLGIAGASALASESAEASVLPAAKVTILKTMFASKMSALITASMVTVSALGGYSIHSMVAQKAAPVVIEAPTQSQAPAQNQSTATPETVPPVKAINQSHASAPKRTTQILKHEVKAYESTSASPTLSGSAPGVVNKPIMDEKPKK
jgi:hypothetical protein